MKRLGQPSQDRGSESQAVKVKTVEAASPPAMLADRASLEPEEPWLFFHGLRGWTWRSYAQVADQVARGIESARAIWPSADSLPSGGLLSDSSSLESCRPAGDSATPESCPAKQPIIALDGRCDPDQIAADLTAQAMARLVIAVDPTEALQEHLGSLSEIWLTSERLATSTQLPSKGRFPVEARLPAADSRLESWRSNGHSRGLRERLELESCVGKLLCTFENKVLWTLKSSDVLALAERLDALLPDLPDRPIIFGSQGAHLLSGRVLQVWTLLRRAAWAFESQNDARLAAAKWVRPHVLWIDIAELPDWLNHQQSRRWSRLRAVIVSDEGADDETREDAAELIARAEGDGNGVLLPFSRLFS